MSLDQRAVSAATICAICWGVPPVGVAPRAASRFIRSGSFSARLNAALILATRQLAVPAPVLVVADVAIAGRRGDALILLRHALASGADPVPIVAAFASKLRTMAKISGARGGSGQLAQQFGLAPWQVDRARRDLQGWDDRGLGRCITLLAETDAAIKGAGRDPVFVLERLVGVISTRGLS